SPGLYCTARPVRVLVMTRRAAGLLLHPTSLPGSFGVGDLGPEAERFLDWAQAADQTLWQVLPLSPTGSFDSPYGGISAFAGNPLLISPERLVEEGLLDPEELTRAPRLSPDTVDFGYVRAWKESLLRSSWKRFPDRASRAMFEELDRFRESPLHATWLADWSLFRAFRDKFARSPWNRWPPELARRDPDALSRARRELSDSIAYHEYVQWLFFRQWESVREKAQRRGISII